MNLSSFHLLGKKGRTLRKLCYTATGPILNVRTTQSGIDVIMIIIIS